MRISDWSSDVCSSDLREDCMRLFWMPVPPALSEAVRACRTHFILAATFSALINILYLAPTIYMMQVYDRVVPTNGVLTLIFITVVVGVAIATLSALDAIRVRLMTRASLRLDRLLSGVILDRLLARSRALPGEPSTPQARRALDLLRQSLAGPAATALFDVPWQPLYPLVAFDRTSVGKGKAGSVRVDIVGRRTIKK